MKRKFTLEVAEPREASRLYGQALRHAKVHPDDLKATFSKLELALAAGSAEAAYALGSWYANGVHVRKNARKAHDLFVKAAKGGVPEALFNLGYAYEAGKFGAVDEPAAYLAYLEAATLGDMDAMYEVARLLRHGIGIPKDVEAAEIWERAFTARGGRLTEKDALRRKGRA